MKTEKDLTQGSLFKGILFFSIPLIFTNLLQILFNMTDSAVVGRFVGAIALGSVGSTTQLVFFCTGLLTGLGGGINVLAAFYIGRKSAKDLSENINTSAIISFLFGSGIFLIGFIFAPQVLYLIKTKDELFSGAVIYFRIYMIAMPAVALYNFGNAILSAHGNTSLPLIFLAVAGSINVILDLLLVIVFKMGVAGVAIATTVSQYISCALTLLAVFNGSGSAGGETNNADANASENSAKPAELANISDFKFSFKNLKINSQKAIEILKIGVPSGLQNCVFALANLFIQVCVNSFDAKMVAGNAATMNGDNLVYDIMAAFYTAGATFIGQNYGARKKQRILKSYFVSVFYAAFVGFSCGTALYIFGRPFLSLFTEDSVVVDFAMQKFKIMTFSFGISAFMDGTIAANRGMGKTAIPSLLVILGSCVFRIAWIYTIFAHFRTIESLFLLYPFSWAITAFAEIIYFVITYKKILKD